MVNNSLNIIEQDKEILIIDYGVGNHLSVTKALDYLGYKYKVSNSINDLTEYQSYILPGVGAFSEAMRNLHALEIIDVLKHEVEVNKKPILGICLGMQLLADSSSEGGMNNGLGFIKGTVSKIENPEIKIKVPQVGWNELVERENHQLFKNIDSSASFYFDHSYHFISSDSFTLAKCDYGEKLIVAVKKNNIFGFQFHPEKSNTNGLKLLRNYFNYIGCHYS